MRVLEKEGNNGIGNKICILKNSWLYSNWIKRKNFKNTIFGLSIFKNATMSCQFSKIPLILEFLTLKFKILNLKRVLTPKL